MHMDYMLLFTSSIIIEQGEKPEAWKVISHFEIIIKN